MRLLLLDAPGLSALYHLRVTADFPPSERKPLSAMLRLLDRGDYHPLLATQEGRPVGYALLWLLPGGGALLEYFATLPAVRGQGVGQEILALLAQKYGQLIAEAEEPSPQAPEDDLRRRRIGFYRRCGFRLLDYRCALFGVPFRCLYLGPLTDDRAVEALHRGVYAGWFSPGHMARHIQLPLLPGQPIHPSPHWQEEPHPLPPGVTLRPLSAGDLTPALFAHFTRRQEVTLCWRRAGDRWTVRPDPFVDDWSPADLRALTASLEDTLSTGGLVLGAFQGDALKGFVAVRAQFFGGGRRCLGLTGLHVSRELRHRGIGRALFHAARNWAGAQGAKHLYLSAHSAVETQAFYRSLGCVDTAHPHPGHVAAEPFDCQLEYPL